MATRGWLDVLTYVSVIAVLVALTGNGMLTVPSLVEPAKLAFAVLALLIGFAATAGAWASALRAAGAPAEFVSALASSGLSVFGKYIPGKVWVIVGMAGHAARAHDLALADAAAAATRLQLVSIWIALVIGAPALLVLEIDLATVLAGVALLLLASVMLMTGGVRAWLEARVPAAATVYAYLWPRNSPLPRSMVLWLVLAWLAWGIGFALLTQALTGIDSSWLLSLVFPFAAVIGLLVLIAPGGIGAREGLLALALTSLALTPEQVASVAVFSRLWFLAGEMVFFVAGWLAAKRLRAQRSRLL